MDLVDFGRYAGGLLVTLGLIAALAYAARRFNFMQFAGGAKSGRLQLVETLTLDARRRAALIRLDGREHLILLGATNETLIESGDAPPEPEPVVAAPPGVQP